MGVEISLGQGEVLPPRQRVLVLRGGVGLDGLPHHVGGDAVQVSPPPRRSAMDVIRLSATTPPTATAAARSSAAGGAGGEEEGRSPTPDAAATASGQRDDDDSDELIARDRFVLSTLISRVSLAASAEKILRAVHANRPMSSPGVLHRLCVRRRGPLPRRRRRPRPPRRRRLGLARDGATTGVPALAAGVRGGVRVAVAARHASASAPARRCGPAPRPPRRARCGRAPRWQVGPVVVGRVGVVAGPARRGRGGDPVLYTALSAACPTEGGRRA